MTKIETVDIKYPLLTTRFAQFLCDELGVKPSKICIASYEIDDGNYGLCIDGADDEFVILVKEQNRNIEEVFTTIAHEMVHVKQYTKENLGWFLDNRLHIPYHERWWEKEAFENSVPLLEKFAKGLNQ